MSGGGGSGKKGGGSQVIGYRYLFGIHMGLGRGPIDELCEIKVADRTAWKGSLTTNGSITIDQPNLFGGEKKEGGIQGTLEVMMGGPDQVAAPGLVSMLVGNMPDRVAVTGTEGGEGDGTYILVAGSSGVYRATIGGITWEVSRQALASPADLDGGVAFGAGLGGGGEGGGF